ncbi:MAG TPA: N-acetylmuramoyl-L-alanine amidase [Chitinophagaceae bacterium]|nr:N-acetylmuramoyl-L-alanine amidase [Chitinophagaceae bacterium]
MIKRTLLFFLATSLCLTIFSFVKDDTETLKKQTVIKTIIVDAGHGKMENGGHNGAKGSFSWEDEICLDVSKVLIKDIAKEFPEIRIVETRPTEKITALHRRASIANENKGDLFVCIHVNSAPGQRRSEIIGYKKVTYYSGKGKNKKKKTKDVPQYRYWTEPSKAKGTETYIWGAHKNDEKELAMRENAQMFEEANFEKNYGSGFDPNSPEFIAMSLLKTKQYFKRSATFAGMIQDEFVKVGRVDRDVRQRGVGIWVLQATAMPSVLIETGFISNPEEEAYLNSKEGQAEISRCIIAALKNYVSWLVKKQEEGGKDGGKDNSYVRPNYTPAATKEFLEMVENNEKKARAK